MLEKLGVSDSINVIIDLLLRLRAKDNDIILAEKDLKMQMQLREKDMEIGMGHRTQTSMFNIGVNIGSDHRWAGNIEQKTSIF
jgi:hypothetical protein